MRYWLADHNKKTGKISFKEIEEKFFNLNKSQDDLGQKPRALSTELDASHFTFDASDPNQILIAGSSGGSDGGGSGGGDSGGSDGGGGGDGGAGGSK